MATEREIQKLSHDVWQDDGGREGKLTMATEQEIKFLAYRLWQEDGEPEGEALAHWDRATEMLNANLVSKSIERSSPERHSKIKSNPKSKRPTTGKPEKVARKQQTTNDRPSVSNTN